MTHVSFWYISLKGVTAPKWNLLSSIIGQSGIHPLQSKSQKLIHKLEGGYLRQKWLFKVLTVCSLLLTVFHKFFCSSDWKRTLGCWKPSYWSILYKQLSRPIGIFPAVRIDSFSQKCLDILWKTVGSKEQTVRTLKMCFCPKRPASNS